MFFLTVLFIQYYPYPPPPPPRGPDFYRCIYYGDCRAPRRPYPEDELPRPGQPWPPGMPPPRPYPGPGNPDDLDD